MQRNLCRLLKAEPPLRYRGYIYDAETGLYYLQSRYYDPEIGRFINADSYTSTGSLLGNNMFAYCLNNPVNGLDPCGTCFHHWRFWEDCDECKGKTVLERINEAVEQIEEVNRQQRELQDEITRKQVQMIQDAGQAVADAYVHSIELEAEAQYKQAMAVKAHWEDTFSTPSRLGDFASMTFTNATAYAGYVALATATTVTTGGVVLVAFTMAFAIRSTLQYYNLLPEMSWEDLAG